MFIINSFAFCWSLSKPEQSRRAQTSIFAASYAPPANGWLHVHCREGPHAGKIWAEHLNSNNPSMDRTKQSALVVFTHNMATILNQGQDHHNLLPRQEHMPSASLCRTCQLHLNMPVETREWRMPVETPESQQARHLTDAGFTLTQNSVLAPQQQQLSPNLPAKVARHIISLGDGHNFRLPHKTHS